MAALERHVPLRSCVVCRTKMPKRDLVRVVVTPEGDCVVDETGKLKGRGAYLCHRDTCWQAVTKGGRLAHALKQDVSVTSKDRLTEYAASMPGEQATAG